MGPMPDAALIDANPRRACRQPVPRRGTSQGVGAVAPSRDPHLVAAGAPAHARERPAGPVAVGRRAGPRAHDGTIIPETRGYHVGHRSDRRSPAKARPPCSSRSTIAPPNASASTPPPAPPASRRWNRSARACAVTSADSPTASPAVSPSATITDRNTCPTTSRRRLAFLGIESSPAFVRAPEGNGCAERFIRTLKENLLWVRTFDDDRGPRQALLAFRETYNTTLADRAARISHPSSIPSETASTHAMAA